MKKIYTKWNILDYIFFIMDQLVNLAIEYKTEPDVECMIEAETKYLKAENESLMELQYPKKVIKDERNYCCPNSKCKKEISSVLIEKYKIKFCPECGQRIYYLTTSHREDNAAEECQRLRS